MTFVMFMFKRVPIISELISELNFFGTRDFFKQMSISAKSLTKLFDENLDLKILIFTNKIYIILVKLLPWWWNIGWCRPTGLENFVKGGMEHFGRNLQWAVFPHRRQWITDIDIFICMTFRIWISIDTVSKY